jgi:hypothetical protein
MIASSQKKPELFPVNGAERVRVIQIAKMDCIANARRRTGRAQAFFYPMNAEMTLSYVTSGRFIPLETTFPVLAILGGRL